MSPSIFKHLQYQYTPLKALCRIQFKEANIIIEKQQLFTRDNYSIVFGGNTIKLEDVQQFNSLTFVFDVRVMTDVATLKKSLKRKDCLYLVLK